LTELNAREYVATVLCIKFFIHQVCDLFIPVTRCEYAITRSHVLLNVYKIALMALKGGSNKNTCVVSEDGRFSGNPFSATFRTRNHGLISLSLSCLLLDCCYKIFICYETSKIKVLSLSNNILPFVCKGNANKEVHPPYTRKMRGLKVFVRCLFILDWYNKFRNLNVKF
jgi:hypothetical protein